MITDEDVFTYSMWGLIGLAWVGGMLTYVLDDYAFALAGGGALVFFLLWLYAAEKLGWLS